MSFITNYLFPKNPYLETNTKGNYTYDTVSKALTEAGRLKAAEVNPENRAKAYQVVKAASELSASRNDNAARQAAGLGIPSDGMGGAIDKINALVPALIQKYDVRTVGDYLRKAAYVAVPLAFAAGLIANEMGYISHSPDNQLIAGPRNANLTGTVFSTALNATSGLARSIAVKAASTSAILAYSGLLFSAVLGACALAKRCFK